MARESIISVTCVVIFPTTTMECVECVRERDESQYQDEEEDPNVLNHLHNHMHEVGGVGDTAKKQNEFEPEEEGGNRTDEVGYVGLTLLVSNFSPVDPREGAEDED